MEENKITQTENSATVFKPEPVQVTFGDNTYNIMFDMNAFVELEKIYSTVGSVIKKVLGNSKKEHIVTIDGKKVDPSTIMVDSAPLTQFLAKLDSEYSETTTSDTLNILYCGLMHDLAIYNEHDEIVGYKVSKQRIASYINFKNLKEINFKLVLAFIRDLVPSENEAKNEMGAEAPKGLHYSAE